MLLLFLLNSYCLLVIGDSTPTVIKEGYFPEIAVIAVGIHRICWNGDIQCCTLIATSADGNGIIGNWGWIPGFKQSDLNKTFYCIRTVEINIHTICLTRSYCRWWIIQTY